jgi:hypothetical protein
MKNNTNEKWITDRLPREEDGSNWLIGQVWISGVDGVYTTHWSEVNKGQPWQPILAPAPYVKPKRWTVEFSAYDNTWIMRDNVEGWVRLLYIDRHHGDAAQRIADIYNDVKP